MDIKIQEYNSNKFISIYTSQVMPEAARKISVTSGSGSYSFNFRVVSSDSHWLWQLIAHSKSPSSSKSCKRSEINKKLSIRNDDIDSEVASMSLEDIWKEIETQFGMYADREDIGENWVKDLRESWIERLSYLYDEDNN